MRKLTPARVSYRHDFLISYHIYMMTGSFHISLFEGTLHVDKMHVWFKIANITHALSVPVYRRTDFTPKRVVVSSLHGTVVRFHTGVKFSPRYKNQGELTPGWLAPAWNLWWYHVNKYRAPVSCKHPLSQYGVLKQLEFQLVLCTSLSCILRAWVIKCMSLYNVKDDLHVPSEQSSVH